MPVSVSNYNRKYELFEIDDMLERQGLKKISKEE